MGHPNSVAIETWHQEHGARVGEFEGGLQIPLDYGDRDAELDVLSAGSGLIPMAWRSVLEISRQDRSRFLNGYVTCDVSALEPGSGALGFVPDARGHILADVVVLALPSRFHLELPAELVQELTAHLQKYVLADRVAMVESENLAFLLIGPRAEPLLETLHCVPPDARWAHVSTEVEQMDWTVQRRGSIADAFSLWVAPQQAAQAAELLSSRGCAPVGFEAFEAYRAEAGLLRFGADFGRDHFPQETGWEDAVSYDKGCYLGQEVIARIHYRGGVRRRPAKLCFEGDSVPDPGQGMLSDGDEVGRLTTAAWSPTLRRPIGLSLLHEKAAEEGARLQTEAGEAAEVADWLVDRASQ